MNQLNVGLLGLGTVGSGVPEILELNKSKITQETQTNIVVTKALVRDDEEKARLSGTYPFELTTNYDDIIHDDSIDVVVELIGKIEPARTFIEKALNNGKSVVTANKDLLAVHGTQLMQLAEKNQLDLYFEASVAGGIPILRTISKSLCADKISQVVGIVNGTTNYMLTKMVSENLSYETALKNAQELGFAESDPTNDVDGIDAAYKTVLLTKFAFGMTIELKDVETTGIRHLTLEDIHTADKLGYVVKLLASSELTNDKVAAEVCPVLVPKAHPLASVQNEMNAIFVYSDYIGQSMYYGPGAGKLPTAASVVADLVTLAEDKRHNIVGEPFTKYSVPTAYAPDEEILAKYYFSLTVPDRTGEFLKLTKLFSGCDISFDKLTQTKADHIQARVDVVTHTITKSNMKRVIQEIKEVQEFELLSVIKVLGEK